MNSQRDTILSWMAGADPASELRERRASGWLQEHFPELDKLYGIEQVAEHHPEVDTGIHMELTLEVAAQLSTDPRARWAALVHDLGKGLTPSHVLPQHIDHEEAGVKPALAVAKRFSLPEEWGWLGAVTARHHLQAHRSLEMRPNSVITFLRKAGFPSRAALFECFLAACEADARGRTGLTGRAYPQAAYLKDVFVVVRDFEIQQMKLEQDRVRAVKPLLQKYRVDGATPE